jgi:peptidoglycan-N-acetylglucosamine deacetylase
MYFARTPVWLQWTLPWYTWRVRTAKKVVFLTFDDGPIPEVTPWVLEMLEKYAARATFFCVGDNVQRHPGIYRQILAAGHAVGNHTFHHVNGWQTDNAAYLGEVAQCAAVVDSRLFRPPYGRLRRRQRRQLQRQYDVILCDEQCASGFHRRFSR